ncbi:MAG TPA: extracellular solute-binding protein [Solirubrobacteraceae bacterium]|nr:extracellular solute-binding protein [Solirubrobacteraceae bacterium]
MRKRQIGVRLAALTAASAAVAVAAAAPSIASTVKGHAASGSVTLKLVAADYGTGPSNTSSKYWDGIAAAFHKANPSITVQVTVIPWTNFDSTVQADVQNGNYPDVTEGDYFQQYAQQGLLYSASQVLSNPKNLLSVFASQGSYDGKQYGMPWTTSSRTLFYNKKLFKEAGIKSAPGTWAAIEADAAKIKKLGKIGFGLPLGPEEAQAESLLWFLGDGGNYMNAAGTKWTINGSPEVTAFNFLKGLVAAGDTEPNPGTVDRTPLWEKFAAGDVGMINGSPALIPIIQAAKVLKSSQWASVPIAGKNGPLSDTLGVCDNVAAFKKNGHEAQIKKFLDFVYQNKYQLQFDREYDLLPATVSAANALKTDPTFGSFIKALPHAVQYPSTTSWAQVKTDIQNTIGTAVTGSPSSVLGSLETQAQKLGA